MVTIQRTWSKLQKQGRPLSKKAGSEHLFKYAETTASHVAKPFVSVCTLAQNMVANSFFQSMLCIKLWVCIVSTEPAEYCCVTPVPLPTTLCCKLQPTSHNPCTVGSQNAHVDWNFLLWSLLNWWYYHFLCGQLCPAVGALWEDSGASKAEVTSMGQRYIGQQTSHWHAAYMVMYDSV